MALTVQYLTENKNNGTHNTVTHCIAKRNGTHSAVPNCKEK